MHKALEQIVEALESASRDRSAQSGCDAGMGRGSGYWSNGMRRSRTIHTTSVFTDCLKRRWLAIPRPWPWRRKTIAELRRIERQEPIAWRITCAGWVLGRMRAWGCAWSAAWRWWLGCWGY